MTSLIAIVCSLVALLGAAPRRRRRWQAQEPHQPPEASGPHGARPPGEPDRGEEVTCLTGLTKEAAEEVLDWLEANGQQPLEFSYRQGSGFTVRYVRPPASEAGK